MPHAAPPGQQRSSNMLFIVGLGLGDPNDITLKGLEIVKRAHKVFLESYTSILCQSSSVQSLEQLYGRDVVIADREMVEEDNNIILQEAAVMDVAFLVVGDPFSATTHSDLLLRAKSQGVPVRVVHNASIVNAVACTGLQLYSFGETVSIPFWENNWKPVSFFDKIISNLERGLHTLCLLDIKVKEKSVEALMRGRDVFEKPRFMSASVAAEQLLAILSDRETDGDKAEQHRMLLSKSSIVAAVARIGSDSQEIVTCTLEEMTGVDLGAPLHSLVIPGTMHPLEEQMLTMFRKCGDTVAGTVFNHSEGRE